MSTSVYVGNLASSTEEDTIRSAFADAGFTVSKVVVMRNPQNDRSRGFGFVDLATLDEAEAAIREMTEAAIDGRPLKLGMARERPPAPNAARSFQSYGGGSGPRRSGGSRRKTR